MKITDKQAAVLIAAVARPDGAILPLPAHIRGGAIGKVCDALVARGLAISVGLPGKQTLVIGNDGRLALGLAIKPMASAETRPTQDRAGTKQAQLVAMLAAPEGASTAEIVVAFGWQPHTVRGAIAGALKKRLGLQIGSEAIEGRGRVYRIMPVITRPTAGSDDADGGWTRRRRCARRRRKSLSARMSDVPEETPPQAEPTPVKKGVSLASRLLLGTGQVADLVVLRPGDHRWRSGLEQQVPVLASGGQVVRRPARRDGDRAALAPTRRSSSPASAFCPFSRSRSGIGSSRRARPRLPSLGLASSSVPPLSARRPSMGTCRSTSSARLPPVSPAYQGTQRTLRTQIGHRSRCRPPARQLQPDQQRVLLQVLPKLKPLLPSVNFMYDTADYEPMSVMQGYQKVFARSGIQTSVQSRQPSGPDDTGIRILVADLRNITERRRY